MPSIVHRKLAWYLLTFEHDLGGTRMESQLTKRNNILQVVVVVVALTS